MRIIVPLAGPDFVGSDGSIKPLRQLDGEPILRRVLESRPWIGQVDAKDYSFILLERPEARAFVQNSLATWYPGATIVFLSHLTRGAALSALAGIAAVNDARKRIIIDLADIFYESTLDPVAAFDADTSLGGIALTFCSDDPVYSYLETDSAGRFIRAAEKKVISNHASAGTYLFASSSVYLRALAHAFENEANETYNSQFFVCPLYNGVRSQGLQVSLSPVHAVRDIKILRGNYQ